MRIQKISKSKSWDERKAELDRKRKDCERRQQRLAQTRVMMAEGVR